MAKESPFGKQIRGRILREHQAAHEAPTEATAWEHVYRLLLSIERRTQLAHVYDANHMQVGGMAHGLAQRFTEALCRRWDIHRNELQGQIDFLFRRCVEDYRAERRRLEHGIGEAQEGEEDGEESEGIATFGSRLAEVLRAKLSGEADVGAVVREIEFLAEEFFTIERKRQNVRGEGFEDTLHWLLLDVAHVDQGRLFVRKRADELPGFRRPVQASTGRKKPRVPKPDLVITNQDGRLTAHIITAKWSLRQDRLDTFAQEHDYYRSNQEQPTVIEHSFITNEFDLARLENVLKTNPRGGGFFFDRVCHVNLDLLDEAHGDRARELDGYRRENRLVSLDQFLRLTRESAGIRPSAPPPPPREKRPRRS